MENKAHTIYIDFDPIPDELGNRGGLLKDEEVLLKCIEVFNDIFAPDDQCDVIYRFSYTVARKKIRRGNAFLKCINNIDFKKIDYFNGYSFFRWHRLVFRSYKKEAKIKSFVRDINIKRVFELELERVQYIDRAVIRSLDGEIELELSLNQWGYRRLTLILNDSKLITSSFDKYSKWVEEDKCKVELDSFTDGSNIW